MAVVIILIVDCIWQFGLYSSFVGCFAYAVLGTSKDVAIGPVAIVSLLVSSFALSPVPGDATYAVIVSVVSGAVQVIIGFLHVGQSVCTLVSFGPIDRYQPLFCFQFQRFHEITDITVLL